MIELELPYPPSTNHYYRNVGPRTIISREGRAYRQRVCAILLRRGVKPMARPLAMHVDVHPPDRRRRDLDNCLKSLLDSLEHGGAYKDDSQIVDLHVRKLDPIPGGKAVVSIEETA